VSQVHRRIRRRSPHILSLHGFAGFPSARRFWTPVTNHDQPLHFHAELLLYETDLVLGGNPQVIR